MNGGEVIRAVIADIGTSQYAIAKSLGVIKQTVQQHLTKDARTSTTAQLLDALGYDLIAVPRRGTKAADGTKAHPYTIDPPKRDKLGDVKPEGKIES